MKNFKISKTKTDLSEEQVEKLYKEYGKIDSKQEKFKGTKREYVDKVGGMISGWLNAVNPKGKLVGGSLIDDLKAKQDLLNEAENHALHLQTLKDGAPKTKKIEENKEYIDELNEEVRILKEKLGIFDVDIEGKKGVIKRLKDERKSINEAGASTEEIDKAIKRHEKELLDLKVGNLFPLKGEMFNKRNEVVPGTLPKVIEKEYREVNKEKVENPFLSTKPGFLTYPGSTPAEMFDNMMGNLHDFKDLFESFSEDETALRNMLVVLPFKQIFDLTPEGKEERKLFVQHLTDKSRGVTHKSSENEWTEASEASYRSERFIFDHYIKSGIKDPEERKLQSLKLFGKILSLQQYQDSVDYAFPFFTGDSKGKKTVGAVGEHQSRTAQVSFDKILSVIFKSFGSNKTPTSIDEMINPQILFNIYKSNRDVNMYNADPRATTNKTVPFEMCLKLDIKEMLSDSKNTESAATILDWYKDWSTKSDKGKRQFFSKVGGFKRLRLPLIKDVVLNYLIGNDVDTFGRKPNGESKFSADAWTAVSGTCLDIPLKTISEPDDKEKAMNKLKEKLKVVGFSNKLFPGKTLETITPADYGNLYSSEEGLSRIRHFHGDTYSNYTFEKLKGVENVNYPTVIEDPPLADVGDTGVADVAPVERMSEEEKEAIDEEVSRLIAKDAGSVYALNRPFFRGTHEFKKEQIKKLKVDKPYLFLTEVVSPPQPSTATPGQSQTAQPPPIPPQPSTSTPATSKIFKYSKDEFSRLDRNLLFKIAYVTGTYPIIYESSTKTNKVIREDIKNKIGNAPNENSFGVLPDGSLQFFQIRKLTGEPLKKPNLPTPTLSTDVAESSDTTTTGDDGGGGEATAEDYGGSKKYFKKVIKYYR